MRLRTLIVTAVLASVAASLSWPVDGRSEGPQAVVALRHDAAAGSVDVLVDGRAFTAYRYGPDFRDKPVFYPVMAPNGVRVNREFPMVADAAGESTDHPHHQSVFFAHDEVNGIPFWNASDSGRRIEHAGIDAGPDRLTARLAWKDPQGSVVLEETKHVSFGGSDDVWWMDHDIVLKAATGPVTIGDTKEGTFAIRLHDTLKEAGGSGRYVNAEGLETEKAVWGRPSDWVAIRGAVAGPAGPKDVTVAIFVPAAGADERPYWHARGYGLFAVNPFGRRSFDPSAPERVTRLAVGETRRFRVRLAVYAGQVSGDRLARDYAGIR